MRTLGIPDSEARLRQLEDAEATILASRLTALLVEFGDHPADALLGDVGDGRIVLALGRLRQLDQDELAVAVVLGVEVEYRVGGGTRAGEEVEDDVTGLASRFELPC